MLLIFNLNWAQLSIDRQVSTSNKRLRELTKIEGVDQKVMFNCASMAGGEYVLDKTEKDTKIGGIVLDSLRRFHQREKARLNGDAVFAANREIAETLISLKRAGHNLAAVWAAATRELETLLEQSRTRDYFDDAVYGCDRGHHGIREDLTYVELYHAATIEGHAAPADTMVVADTREGIAEAKYVKPRAVIGYVAPYIDKIEQGRRLREMETAGANFAVTRAHDVAAMPWRITGVSGIYGDSSPS